MKLVFEQGTAVVTLPDGRIAMIYENRSGYYRRMMYTLAVNDEVIFTRAGLDKIRNYLHSIM